MYSRITLKAMYCSAIVAAEAGEEQYFLGMVMEEFVRLNFAHLYSIYQDEDEGRNTRRPMSEVVIRMALADKAQRLIVEFVTREGYDMRASTLYPVYQVYRQLERLANKRYNELLGQGRLIFPTGSQPCALPPRS